MALEDLVGGTLAVGFHGTEPTEELVAALRRTRARSLVVFARNFISPDQFRRLLAGLERGVGRRLLVMVDHEGGRIVRFSGGVTRFPSAREAAAARDPAAIERQGLVEAQELRALGVRVNLAPCLDVAAAGADPIIGDRSYGTDPALVAELGAARIRGLQAGGVAACAKHFPGLGAVPRDPHLHLPTIGLEWTEMDMVHLVPFRAAIRAGAAMAMSSHACYPRLGDPPGLPATFSPRLIRELLRARLEFQGLMLTDDLEMGALRSFGSIAEAAERAVKAGHDLLLICSDLEAAAYTVSHLCNLYSMNALDVTSLKESARRFENFLNIFSK